MRTNGTTATQAAHGRLIAGYVASLSGARGDRAPRPLDPQTLQTAYDGVFAIGDVTAIRLANGMFLPKAGVFADEQARVVAANIAAEITGEVEATQYGGYGSCYIEVGDGMAAYGSGNFYGLPGPRVALEPPSLRYRQEKEELERALLALWQ